VSLSAPVERDFLELSRRFLDLLGADGLGSESDQRHFAVDGTEPAWVVLPAAASETAQVLRLCAEHGLAVVPAGAGLRLGRGLPPERLDVVLSTSRMDRIVAHAASDLTITVEAGATLAAVNEVLRPSGQWLPFDPPLPAETTIGGLVAAQASGPSRQAFGTARDRLLGLAALLADGTPVKSGGRVVKNVAGYDLHKLLVGSLGTLAVIVEATFKLQPLPEARRIVCFGSEMVESLCRLAIALADSVLSPERLEIIAGSGRPPTLVAGFAGTHEEVDDAAARTVSMARARAVEESSEPIDEAALAAALEGVERGREPSVVLRAGVPRSSLERFLSSALWESGRVAGAVAVHAHAGVGVARLRLEAVEHEPAREVVGRLRGDARASGGYLAVESAPAAWKGDVDVWGPPPAGFDLMKGVKAAFDPLRLLSPGRFVGGV
jgi:glycolate dehydrogenase FAD-binding subunit